jgi:iron complex transport system substrate-binding protein
VLLELPRTLGFAEGEAGRAAQVEAKRQAMRLAQQIDAALTPSEAAVQAGPVLLLWSVDPPAAFGPESFLGELLERLGGRNVIEVGGYPGLTLEDVLHLDPSTIVLFADDEADVDAAARLGRLATLDIKAARLERLALVQDPQVLLPTTTLPRIAAKFERALATLPPLPQESRGTQAPTAGEGEQP